MIFDELAKTTNEMQKLQNQINIQKNKDAQAITDNKLRITLTQSQQFVECIDYLYCTKELEKNYEIITSISNIFLKLEEAIASGIANADDVVSAETMYKSLQSDVKKEWQKRYSDLTNATLSTLDAVKSINAEKALSCINQIQVAEAWSNSLEHVKKLFVGLDEASQLIEGLGLDDEITTFLSNANAGKATLKDLNEKVYTWIKNENLEGKIRISFVKSGLK